MADLSQLVELSESLIQAHTLFDKTRCIPLRNRFSRCSRCVDACPVAAITLLPRSLTVDKTSCVNCGSCSTVCPVQALIPLEPSDDDLARATVAAIEAAETMACFACARVMAKRGPDPAKVVTVDCLSRVDESLILGLAAHGVDTIVLADGNCDTCKYKTCGRLSHQIADQTNELLEAMGSSALVISTTGVPEELHTAFDQEALNEERRNLFFHTKEAMTETARHAAAIGLKGATGVDLVAKAAQVMEADPQRHNNLVNALEQLGEPQDMTVSSRCFGSVRIDRDKCTTCNKCVLTCPPKALQKSLVAREDGQGIFFEFNAWKCVRCHLCMNVCQSAAITVEDVNMTEIFQLEPRLIPVPPEPVYQNPGLFWKGGR